MRRNVKTTGKFTATTLKLVVVAKEEKRGKGSRALRQPPTKYRFVVNFSQIFSIKQIFGARYRTKLADVQNCSSKTTMSLPNTMSSVYLIYGHYWWGIEAVYRTKPTMNASDSVMLWQHNQPKSFICFSTRKSSFASIVVVMLFCSVFRSGRRFIGNERTRFVFQSV